jgi:hypothetical protein
MTDKEIIQALDDRMYCGKWIGKGFLDKKDFQILKNALDLINRQQAEIERLKEELEIRNQKRASIFEISNAYERGRAKAIKEFAEKVDELLSRYSHLHKQADEVRQSTEEYADGTPMEMVSVWEVLSLKKWEMCDYETMNTLQDNIETIEKARLLSELEKDFMLLKKEMVGECK